MGSRSTRPRRDVEVNAPECSARTKHVAALEAEVRVAREGAGQEAHLSQDLKAVADADDGATAFREGLEGRHDGREARDGAGAQVVAVGEAAGHDDGVRVSEGRFFVKDVSGVGAKDVPCGVEGVPIRVRPWKLDNGDFHGAATLAARSRIARGVLPRP
jgi:hypothetical protein